MADLDTGSDFVAGTAVVASAMNTRFTNIETWANGSPNIGVAGSTTTMDGALTVTQALQNNSTVTVGVDDTGYDVQMFGATSGSYLLWDESANALILTNADFVPSTPTGRRNLIINGSMYIIQASTEGRAVTYTYGTGSGTRHYPVERFWTGNYRWSAGTDITVSRDATVFPTGHTQSYKVTSSGTGLTFSSGGYLTIEYTVEAQDIAPYYAETAMTLSFWCRSTDTGIFNVMFANEWWGTGSADRGLSKEFTISSADTWEHKTITFDLAAGTASGTWAVGSGIGLTIEWVLGAHADRTGDEYLDTWATWSGYEVCTDSNIQLMTGANSNFYLTGVQLEVGGQATPFENRPYVDELTACKRYYQVYDTAASNYPLAAGVLLNTTTANCVLHYEKSMRAAPTIVVPSVDEFDVITGGGTQASTNVTFSGTTLFATQINITASSLTAGQGTLFRGDGGEIILKAEMLQ